MSQEQWADVDRYLVDLLVPPDPGLDRALTSSAEASLPAINVAPNQGKLLYLLALACRARTVLEIGTLGGYSTIWLARALPADGHLLSLELDPRHAEVARANIAAAGLSQVAEVVVGAATETLARLVEEGRHDFDLVFIDADKPSTLEYFKRSLQLTHPGSLIVVDNVVRGGKVADAGSDDSSVRGMRRLLDHLAQERRVQSTAVQTVGVKGHDGFVLSVVTSDGSRTLGAPTAG